jgi:glutamate--cysteine ligase
MYFVKRGDTYHDVSGRSFRDLLAGKVASLPGQRATISDWANHLTTTFPEVRLKRYLEMRGADAGPSARLCALSALWAGLLYDQNALDAAWDLVKDWSAAERQQLRDDVPRLGFGAEIRGRKARDLARDVVSLSRHGLVRRARLDRAGRDETHFLEPLEALIEAGATPAEGLLRKYHNDWHRSVDPVFTELAY